MTSAERIASINNDLLDNHRRARALTTQVWQRMVGGWRPTREESDAVITELADLAEVSARLQRWRDAILNPPAQFAPGMVMP